MANRRLWDFICYSDKWNHVDTSRIDDISPSWLERRELLKNNSQEYAEFVEKLKREHAIETGIVERMYELERGTTEMLIENGIIHSLLSHGDTNIPANQLFLHLKDHSNAIDAIFDIVKEDRSLTTSFIKELHQLVTRNQKTTEGIDTLGERVSIRLLKGTYKESENNPVKNDGSKVLYCPPVHVESEMDNLVSIYHKLESQKKHPIVLSAWFHHAFTTIHPFQDGNGRVGRLLSSLILIKYGFFPFTVLREEAKLRYFDALEKADKGEIQPLVDYFVEGQRRNIDRALNIKEVNSNSLREVRSILTAKITNWKNKLNEQNKQRESKLITNRNVVFDVCKTYFENLEDGLAIQFGKSIQISLMHSDFTDTVKQQYYYGQIVNYAKYHNYYFNHSLPRSWITFRIEFSKEKAYQLCISIHHYGYGDSTLSIGAFLEFLDKTDRTKGDVDNRRIDAALPLEIKPHIVSIHEGIPSQENIELFLENIATLTLAQIASEF